MYRVEPQTILAATIVSSTLAEDPTSAWASGTNYAIGAEVHLASTHRVYRNATAGASTVSPDVDTARWKDMRPTNKWAPFDWYTSTQAKSTATDITYVLKSRFANAVLLYGLDGAGVVVSVRNVATNTVIYRYPGPVGSTAVASLKASARGYWDYAYGDRRKRRTIVLTGLPIAADVEITVTVSAASGEQRAVGLIAIGKLRQLAGRGWYAVQQGSAASPKTYTSRKTADDGTQTIVIRGSSKDLECKVFMDIGSADQAVEELGELLSRPCAYLADPAGGTTGLTAFGIPTRAPVRYFATHAECDLNIEGFN